LRIETVGQFPGEPILNQLGIRTTTTSAHNRDTRFTCSTCTDRAASPKRWTATNCIKRAELELDQLGRSAAFRRAIVEFVVQ